MEILAYIPQIVMTIAAVTMIVYFLITFIKASPEKKKQMIHEIIYSLALEAERLYGSKTGQAKKKQVIAWLYERYPSLAYILSEAQLSDYIDSIVDEMNEWLLKNPVGAKNILPETKNK